MLRLDKALSDMGIGTRSVVRRLVREGKVDVDGRAVFDPSQKIDETSARIYVEGEYIAYARHVYLMLNKPSGYLSATVDTKGKTVMELLPENYRRMGLFPAGRLDADTVGFLILTNDGAFAHGITAPRRHVDKVYYARVLGPLAVNDVRAFSEGVALDDGTVCLPAGLAVLSSGEVSEAEVTLREGKFHQVKRMFSSRGRKVLYLKRVSIGGVKLDPELAEGKFRPLTGNELTLLYPSRCEMKT